MRLDQALVSHNLCDSRKEAQELITLGAVIVDGVITTKQTKQVGPNTTITVTKRRPFVSRGGLKLEGAFLKIWETKEKIKEMLLNKKAIDVGSSTGGFTDCLLSYGAITVTAVDVGSSQLHPRLVVDPRVISLEKTDIRNFVPTHTFDIVVADLSFISLENITKNIISLGKEGSDYFILIKPQFEVGKGNTKKGIVKNELLTEDVLAKYKSLFTEYGLQHVQIFPCHIEGGDGNQEYFLYGKLKNKLNYS